MMCLGIGNGNGFFKRLFPMEEPGRRLRGSEAAGDVDDPRLFRPRGDPGHRYVLIGLLCQQVLDLLFRTRLSGLTASS